MNTQLSSCSINQSDSIDPDSSISSNDMKNNLLDSGHITPLLPLNSVNPQISFSEQSNNMGDTFLDKNMILDTCSKQHSGTLDTCDESSFLSLPDSHITTASTNCWMTNSIDKRRHSSIISVNENNFEIQYMELEESKHIAANSQQNDTADDIINEQRSTIIEQNVVASCDKHPSNPNEARDDYLCAPDFATEAMSYLKDITAALSCDNIQFHTVPKQERSSTAASFHEVTLTKKRTKHSSGRPIIYGHTVEDPTLSEAYSQKSIAIELFDKGFLQEAFVILQEVLDLSYNAGLPENHPLVTDTMWRCNSVQIAIEILQEADEMHELGAYYEDVGDYHNALESYQCSLNKKRQARANVSVCSLLRSLHKIGVIRWKIGAYNEALDILTEALNVDGDILTKTSEIMLTTADILTTIGNAFLSKGDYREAQKFFNSSLTLRRNVYGCDDHADIARSIIGLGMVCDQQGKYKRAMKCFLQGLRIQKMRLDNDSVDIATTLNSIGVIYEKRRLYEDAMNCYQEALWIYRTSLGNHHVDVAVTLVNVGQVQRYSSEYGKSMMSYQEALRIFRNLLGDTHRNVASTMYNMGLIHVANQDSKKAMNIFKEVFKLQKDALGGKHIDMAVTLDSMGQLLENSGKYEKGFKLYKKALKVRRTALGKDHLYVGITLEKLGCFCQDNLIDNGKAFHYYTAALDVYKANSLKQDNRRLKHLIEKINQVQLHT